MASPPGPPCRSVPERSPSSDRYPASDYSSSSGDVGFIWPPRAAPGASPFDHPFRRRRLDAETTFLLPHHDVFPPGRRFWSWPRWRTIGLRFCCCCCRSRASRRNDTAIPTAPFLSPSDAIGDAGDGTRFRVCAMDSLLKCGLMCLGWVQHACRVLGLGKRFRRRRHGGAGAGEPARSRSHRHVFRISHPERHDGRLVRPLTLLGAGRDDSRV